MDNGQIYITIVGVAVVIAVAAVVVVAGVVLIWCAINCVKVSFFPH